jgi:hypothetical protein
LENKDEMKQDNIKNIKVIICLLGISVCLLLLVPQIRQMIINITEQFLVNRELRDHTKWHDLLWRISINGIILLGTLLFLFLTNLYKKFLLLFTNEIQKVPYKKFLVPVLCTFGLYTFGIASIIRANFLYIDDLARTIQGYRHWDSTSRYICDLLAVFLHADTHITDISPLPQIIAAFFSAVSSVLLIFIISDGKTTKRACFLSLPVGLSPYFLECFSYKFDSPYMALSVLASIVPFLFTGNYIVFSLCSIFSLLIMLMTYQASSGIYIIIVIMLMFKAWNIKEKNSREIIQFAGVSAFSYCFSMIYFRLFLMKSYDAGVSSNIFPIQKLFYGTANNFSNYMTLVNGDFGFIWKILLIFLFLTFIITSIFLSKRNKFTAFGVSFLVLTVMIPMSFGAYLILSKPLFFPRAMYGFGIFIACITIFISNIRMKVLLLPAVLLCWCFFVFSFTYGNALSEQKRYNNFRTEILLHDLSVLFPEKTEEPLLIKLINSEGFAPSVKNISIRNPVINRLVPVNLGAGWEWSYIFLTSHFNFNLKQDESIAESGLVEILDSYYHTIKSSERKVLVIFK